MTKDGQPSPREPVVFSGREMDVMAVLWRLGSGTVAEIQEELEAGLAYNTVLTVLRRLEEKGHVGHESEGKAHRYHALVRKEEAQDGALERVRKKLFADSPELLMARLLRKGALSRKQLRTLRDMVDERLAERGEE